jgi:hypothetical protein
VVTTDAQYLDVHLFHGSFSLPGGKKSFAWQFNDKKH